MGGSCGLVLGILVLILAVTGTQAQCTEDELKALIKCILPYDNKFRAKFGRGGLCNRTLISGDVCDDFDAIVVCANKKDVSRSACRPYAACQISKNMEIPCKIDQFEEVCTDATAIDKGYDDRCGLAAQEASGHGPSYGMKVRASGVGISLGLLGAVIIVSLIAHM